MHVKYGVRAWVCLCSVCTAVLYIHMHLVSLAVTVWSATPTHVLYGVCTMFAVGGEDTPAHMLIVGCKMGRTMGVHCELYRHVDLAMISSPLGGCVR